MRLRSWGLTILLAACLIPSLSFAVDKVNAGKWLVYANALYKAHDYDKAQQGYTNSLKLDNTNAGAYQGLGNCMLAKGDKASAIKYYKYSLQLNPNNTALANWVASATGGAPAGQTAAGTSTAAAPSGPKDWVSPLWRSAILPGWGQFYNKEPVKGWIIGGLALGALTGTVVTYVIGNAAEQTYLGLGPGLSQDQYDTPYNTWDSMANMNHIFYITFGLVYTYNLIDAYWNAKPAVHHTAMLEYEPPVQLSLLPEGGFRMDATLLRF
jgi:tetratricopeptide (TPR) repeat protein